MTVSIGESREYTTQKKMNNLAELMCEFDALKRQTERLERINLLHLRLSGLLSCVEMVDAYSAWLSPQIESELIGYADRVRGHKHFSCLSHGPIRRKVLEFADKLLASDSLTSGAQQQNGLYAHKWLFESGTELFFLLVLKRDRQLNEEETALVGESLNILASSLKRALHYEELIERASRDPLTGLANRRVLDERVGNIMERSRRYRQPVSMVVMDLDYFKQVNDTFGHPVGDEVLVAVARVLQANIRSTDLLVRLGGDEFLAILENSDGVCGAKLARRFCDKVRELDVFIDNATKLGVSIGVAELESDESASEWLARADDSLYQAKARGRNQVALYS